MEMTSIFNNRDLVKEIMIKEEKNKLWYGHIVNYKEEIKDEAVDWWLPVGEGRGEGQEGRVGD